MSGGKIVSLDELAEISRKQKHKGARVVQCHGAFDLMHVGHIRHLQRARAEGDVLLVTITADAYINKGPGRPVFNEQLRAENLAALACVDYVALFQDATAVEALHKIQPNIYAKGSDYQTHTDDITGNIAREKEAVETHRGRIFYTDELTFSSSSLLNEHFGVFPPETKQYLKSFRRNWSDGDVRKMLQSLSKARVLVVGDAIVDEYHYTAPLGQAGKGNILAVRYESEEKFAGGAMAVANHIAGFCEQVTLVTGLGEIDSHETFIRSKLLPNVTPEFFCIKGAPTVTKRRFVDGDLSKLFEVYFYKEDPALGSMEQDVCRWLEKRIGDFDIVVVPDFGNGFISSRMIEVLCQRAPYLAVNTQINSGNRGYHVIHRYPRVDFASLNEPEVRLAAYNRQDPIETVAEKVCDQISAKCFAVTRGTRGVVMLDRTRDVMHTVPALSTKVIDRIGAGDAFLSLTGLCLGTGLPSEVAAFIGSAAAALDVQIVCNREPVSSLNLNKYVTTLLK
ncbi:MAG: adenylyltransferase/cytidyltransferase family protein [Gammaproteobacteria bacterium]|nr:adenylyltransferase/cytidyltransferase family protein [Gammaproteobacteria bacterium]